MRDKLDVEPDRVSRVRHHPIGDEGRAEVLVAGFGRWGRLTTTTLHSLPSRPGISIVDTTEAARGAAARVVGVERVFATVAEALTARRPSALLVCTPPVTHYDLGMLGIAAGVPTGIEKPFTGSVRLARALARTAAAYQTPLFAGFTFLFDQGVIQLRRAVRLGEIGLLRTVRTVRTNVGTVREDIDVFHDLLVHDMAVTTFISGRRPLSARCVDKEIDALGRVVGGVVEVEHADGVRGRHHVSWHAAEKCRQVSVEGTEATVTITSDPLAPGSHMFPAGSRRRSWFVAGAPDLGDTPLARYCRAVLGEHPWRRLGLRGVSMAPAVVACAGSAARSAGAVVEIRV